MSTEDGIKFIGHGRCGCPLYSPLPEKITPGYEYLIRKQQTTMRHVRRFLLEMGHDVSSWNNHRSIPNPYFIWLTLSTTHASRGKKKKKKKVVWCCFR
ncbi:hypothetical protein GWI33_002839 [Rhynchophorus ferrugineus]|uniref:Uncharacterized protein n=1 Tax=Rhynchophorus ferrugineus TaxID=354439 RepID=A0A834IV45_RHYFE|nr:hypothetical protein GWI33_002839 [Rhynchophorus ferrugineus]